MSSLVQVKVWLASADMEGFFHAPFNPVILTVKYFSVLFVELVSHHPHVTSNGGRLSFVLVEPRAKGLVGFTGVLGRAIGT